MSGLEPSVAAFGHLLTTNVQFLITSLNAWIVFSSSDIIHVSCVHTRAAVEEGFSGLKLSFEDVGRLFGFKPTNLWLRGDILECALLDEAYLNVCATINGAIPDECETLRQFAGIKCYKTEAVATSLLALFCMCSATCLIVFMRLDAAGTGHHPEVAMDHNHCPPFVQRRRFSCSILPIALLSLAGVVLMFSSVSLGTGCLFKSAPYMAMMLVCVWAVFSVLMARRYEAQRDEQEFHSCRSTNDDCALDTH
eukprot:TRINITY_DN7047_c0_g1_i1.p1 TRINITY_DN7047_c0_g1~~TRINITY_DN7047_c0_g1_i1.p1  ORF type:complete len:264 (+),score=21.92 TRINITY_DN7047_c0_g1_i1:42-794(+)